MVLENNEGFHCVVVSPQGKLLDCEVTSVVFTAHDGSVGVLRNHMPMLCQLGLGILEVKILTPDSPWNGKEFILVNDGFVLVVANTLKVIAYEATSFKDMAADRIERIVEKAQNKFDTGSFTPEQLPWEKKKLTLLVKLAELSNIPVHK